MGRIHCNLMPSCIKSIKNFCFHCWLTLSQLGGDTSPVKFTSLWQDNNVLNVVCIAEKWKISPLAFQKCQIQQPQSHRRWINEFSKKILKFLKKFFSKVRTFLKKISKYSTSIFSAPMGGITLNLSVLESHDPNLSF